MAQNNGSLKMAKLVAIILGIVLTVGGLVWAVASRGADLENVIADVSEHETQLDRHETEIVILKTQQTAIFEGVKRIEDKLND